MTLPPAVVGTRVAFRKPMKTLPLCALLALAQPALALTGEVAAVKKKLSSQQFTEAKKNFLTEWKYAYAGPVGHVFSEKALDEVIHSFLGNSPAQKIVAAMNLEKTLANKVSDFRIPNIIEGDGTGNHMGAARRAMSADEHFRVSSVQHPLARTDQLRAYDILAKLDPSTRGKEKAILEGLMASNFIGPRDTSHTSMTMHFSSREPSRYAWYKRVLKNQNGGELQKAMNLIDELEAMLQPPRKEK